MKSNRWFAWAAFLLSAGIVVLSVDLASELFQRRPIVPAVSRIRPDLARFRALADVPGAPVALNRLLIARQTPGLTINSFQLVYGERDNQWTVLIDTGVDARLYEDLNPREIFYPKAYERFEIELARTEALYFTRESFDHVGGVSRSPSLYGIRDRLKFTYVQLRSPFLKEARIPPAVLEAMSAIDCDAICSPAPGIVLFAAPGATPGAQWIYARLVTGREYLLVGEKSISLQEIQTLRPRQSRFAYWAAGHNGEVIAHQLRALHTLFSENKSLVILPVHDESALIKATEAGYLGDGFDYDSPFSWPAGTER